jgi:hypothetical protein
MFNVSTYSQENKIKNDSIDYIEIVGKINKIQFLMDDWKGQTKTYQYYWVEINVDIDEVTLKNIFLSLEINPKNDIPKTFIFTSGNNSFRDDLDIFEKYKVGNSVKIHARKESVEHFLKNEKENILISEISLL